MLSLRWLVRAAAGVVSVALAAGGPTRADERGPVPPEEDLDKAQTTVRALFKAEYAKTRAADRIALGAKLFQQAMETKDDPAARFILLREARDLAAKAAEPFGVVRAADELTALYALRPGEAILPAVPSLVATSNSAAQVKLTARTLIAAADEARAAGEWNTALALLKGAAAAAGKASVAGLGDTIRAKMKDTEAMKAEEEKIKDAVATLKTTPADPAANLAVGRFLAFFRQDWDGGIPLLAKGADEKLQVAAERDLKAAAGTDEDKTAAADSWYALIPSVEPAIKAAVQVRAHHWYAAALGTQTGLNKTRLEKRIAELQAVVDARADRTKMWVAVRRGAAGDRLARGAIVGGAFSKKTFEEILPGGGLLIGFHYTTKTNGKYPGVVQAIYLTPQGEQLGAAYGTPGQGETILTTKARPGYAVGGLTVRGGGGFDAFKPTYMRITNTGLNPKDSYDGPQIGGTGGTEGRLGGDGGFIVGLHGKVTDKGLIAAMSTISTPPAADEPRPPKAP